MNAEFQWWLLIVGIVIGGALVYLVLADLQGDRDATQDEEPVDDEESDDAGDWPTQAPDPASVGDDATVQRDGAQREPTIADVP
ncbi:MAG: hypothetical protein QOF11_2591 [Chloroflexota bacterium]|nr:hypothetical protein [Chloroflexota bacterium]